MNEPKKIDEYKLKKIRTYIINHIMREPCVMFEIPEMPNGGPDLIDIIVGLYEYLHVAVTGEEYDYMWHFANKIGAWCDTYLFDKYIESDE